MGSGSDLGICANIIRIILVIINILFVLLGAVLIGVGSWAIANGNSFAFLTGSDVFSGAALLIVAGIVTVIICATGVFGAIFKLRPILVIYAIVVALIVILEIVAGILGFVFSAALGTALNNLGLETIALYNSNPDGATPEQQDATNLVNVIQNTFSCCGLNSAQDWFNNSDALRENNDTPPGYNVEGSGCFMCDPATAGCMTFSGTVFGRFVSFNVTDRGCLTFTQDNTNLIIFASVTGGLGIVFGLLEIAGIVFAFILCCCITSARRQEVV